VNNITGKRKLTIPAYLYYIIVYIGLDLSKYIINDYIYSHLYMYSLKCWIMLFDVCPFEHEQQMTSVLMHLEAFCKFEYLKTTL